MDNITFLGTIAEPEHYTGVGVLVIANDEQRGLLGRLANIGCLSVSVTIPKQAQHALQFIYRFSTKLIVIGMGDNSTEAIKLALETEDVDAVVSFDPDINSLNFNNAKELHAMIALFYSDEIKATKGKQFKDVLVHIGKDCRVTAYTKEDWDQFNKSSQMIQINGPDYDPVWAELIKIIQFI